MAVATDSLDFDTWLNKKLQALKTDEGVYGSYIKGILQGDETEDEKTEALESILAGITEDNIGEHASEILTAWAEWLPSEDVASGADSPEDVEVRLARMLESQTLPTTTQRSYTEEERRIREAILAQYSQMSDDEDGQGAASAATAGASASASAAGEDNAASTADCGIERNTNAATIAQQERERRERAKLESQRKKEKDKEDREKQKQLREEKKEKRKTQKGERRR